MKFPHIRRTKLVVLAATTALTLTVAGCGGNDDSGSAKSSSSGSGLEKTTINVGTLPVADLAQLKIAADRGFFKAEGLTVKTQMLQGGAEAVPKLKSGNLDISGGAFVPFFLAEASGAIKLHIVADAFQSAPGTHVILVAKDSPIKSVRDLAGKKIGINVKRNLGSLMMQATLQPQGVKIDDFKDVVEIPFPNMQQALSTHSVDAVQAVEPFNTQIQKAIGARQITDLSQGVTANFPIAGYASTQEWAAKNPKTLAAFQRAISKAQALLTDRQILNQTLPTYTKIKPDVAAAIHVGLYPASIDMGRLKRVSDLMVQYGYIPKPIDVQSMVSSTG
jgi:NitT/TauT family transport system substrate-binding protein